MPVITLNSVVLPAPLGPITLTISCSSTWRSSSCSARSPPKEWRDLVELEQRRHQIDLDAWRAEQSLGPRRHHHDEDRTSIMIAVVPELEISSVSQQQAAT